SSETGTMKTYTFDAGQFTVSKAASNPSNEQYAKNTQDVVALVATVDAGQAIIVDGLRVYFHQDTVITGADTAANIQRDIERAELFVNDKKIATETTVAGSALDANGTYSSSADFHFNFDSNFTVNDEDLIKLVLDLEDNASTGTYKF